MWPLKLNYSKHSCIFPQVGSNAGIIGMTKEHLGLALALNVPVFVVVTKIDMCPANILQGTSCRGVFWLLFFNIFYPPQNMHTHINRQNRVRLFATVIGRMQ